MFGLSAWQVDKRIREATKAAGLGDGFSGHSCRVGMAQDLTAAGFSLVAVQQAGRWKSPSMPARCARNLRTDRGAVAMLQED